MNYLTTFSSGRTFVILIYFILFTVSSCKFPVYVLTDKKLKEHYKDRKIKPELKYLSYKNYHIEKIVKEYNASGRKIYLMGSSYGAPIAASFVTQNPDLVEELYLVSPVIDPATEFFFWFSYAAKLGPVNWLLPQSLNVTSDEKFAHRRELRKLKPHW